MSDPLRVSRLLPSPMLHVVVLIVLMFMPTLARRAVSGPRFFMEAFVVSLAAVARVWATWVLSWWIEQRR